MTDETHLILTKKDNVTVIGFKDPTILDAYHVNEVSKELFGLIGKEGYRLLVLDFSTIKMLSSQTLSVLLKMRQELDAVDGRMVLSGIDPGLYRVFRITNLQSIFEFFSDIDSAVEHLKSL
jgi:anti-anti-sigma factor